MTSLAQQIRDRRAKESHQPPAGTAAPVAEPYIPDPLPANLPPAAVCAAPCLCPGFWLDPYGKLHCFECRPPKVASQVRRQLLVVTADGGGLEWSDLLATPRPGATQHATQHATQKNNFQLPQKQTPLADVFLIRQLTPPPGIDSEEWWQEISERSVNIEKINSGSLKNLATAKKKAPMPPAGAAIWSVLSDGSTSGPGTKNKPTDKKYPVLITWEGAGEWYPVDPPEHAEQPGQPVAGAA